MSRDEKKFDNPTQGFRYQGSFTVTFVPGTNTKPFPRSVVVSGNSFTLLNGTVQGRPGGIAFFTKEHYPFYLGYEFIERVLRSDGSLLWVNKNKQ